jgi:hypothetical protein
MFDTWINLLTNEIWTYKWMSHEFHIFFVNLSVKCIFNAQHSMYRTYKLWMNKFYTISIIKSWNVKFVMSNDQNTLSILLHLALLRSSQTLMALLLQWIHACKFCEWWICLQCNSSARNPFFSPLQFENPNNPHTQVLDQNKWENWKFTFGQTLMSFCCPLKWTHINSTTGQLDWGFWAAIGSAQNNLHGCFNSSQVLHQWAAWLLDCGGRNRLCPE